MRAARLELDRSGHLEAVPAVERKVARVRGLEISADPGPVGELEAGGDERRAEASPLTARVDAEHAEVVVRPLLMFLLQTVEDHHSALEPAHAEHADDARHQE